MKNAFDNVSRMAADGFSTLVYFDRVYKPVCVSKRLGMLGDEFVAGRIFLAFRLCLPVLLWDIVAAKIDIDDLFLPGFASAKSHHQAQHVIKQEEALCPDEEHRRDGRRIFNAVQ